MKDPANLFDLIFSDSPANEEITNILHQSHGVRIERIVSTGQVSPDGFWYDQEEDEWVALLDGEAQIMFEDGTVFLMSRGDHLLIPAHCRHRVTYTSSQPPAVWLAVFIRKFAQ